MRVLLLATLAGLAACATVEERTDRGSGPGLTQGSMASDQAGASTGSQSAEVAMVAPDKVPQFAVTVPGATGDRTEAARAAASFEADPKGVGVLLAGSPYWLRQVRANSIEFAVAEPDAAPANGAASSLPTFAASRIGCLLTGETWTFDGVLVAGLNCR